MKLILVILAAFPICCWSLALDKEIKLDLTAEAEKSAEATITKRSGGSFDFVAQIKKGILSGAGRASAALASGSSGSSSSYNKPVETVHANAIEEPWSFKKSVLNTIFQAVKAITGGVTAIKGQIIKGSGYALSAGGSLIAASGDKITDVGKGIVNSAQFAPAHSSPAVAHPIPSKFASLSSASSGGSHGSSGHGETVTYHEIPSGHQSYGPPPKTQSQFTSTSYLPPGTYTTGLHYAGPSSFDGSAHGYLPPGEVPFYRITHSHHHHDNDGIYHNYYLPPDNYVSPSHRYEKYVEFVPPHKKRPNPHRFKYFNPHAGPSPPYMIDRDGNSASMVLKEIMQFLPKQETNKLTETYNSAPNRHKLVDQYDIPSDPIPTYTTFKVGPITSISRTNTVTAAFGTPLHIFQKPIPEPLAHNSLDRRPPMHKPLDNSHHSYDAYHAMSLRQQNRPGMGNTKPAMHTPLKTPYEIPMKHLDHMPWKVSLNGPTPLAPISPRQNQSPPEPSVFLATPYPSPPTFMPHQSSQQQSYSSNSPHSNSRSSHSPPQPSNPPSTPLPIIDIEAIVARLEAKKRGILDPSIPVPVSPTAGSRTDRQFSDADDNSVHKGSNVEVQKSVEFQITDPNSFNRELMYL